MIQHETFESFCTQVVAGNNLLEGDTLHLTHDNLRKTIEGNMAQYLADTIAVLLPEECSNIDKKTDFYEWEAEILRVDCRFRSHVNYVQDLNNSSKCQADSEQDFSFKKPHLPDQFSTSSHPATGTNAISNKENAFSSFRTPFRTPCSKLTDDERVLLNQYSSCCKCRQLFVNHKANNCPNGFPDGCSYKTITQDLALSLAAKKAIAATYQDQPSLSDIHAPPLASVFTFPSHTPPVAAAIPFDGGLSPIHYVYGQPSNNSTSDMYAFIQEVNDNFASTSSAPPVPVAALASLPSSEINYVLSPESDDGSIQSTPVSDSFDSYSYCGPISVEHLRWKAAALGHNDFPVPFDCLIDNGAHLVLIRPETVQTLGLKIHKLKNPELVSLAFKQDTGATSFTDCVTLSLNNAWTSLPVLTILAPNLCTDILLGLPFLSRNKIVVDHELRTAIVTTSSGSV